MACLLAAYIFLLHLEKDRLVQEREKVHYIIENYATKIQYVITNAFSSAYLVDALVRQGKGKIEHFDSYAAELVKMHPSTVNINLAPGGVVSEVFPYERNKRALGHDLFRNPARNREAVLARDSGRATAAGPFTLVQGGYAMAVRLPVYLHDDKRLDSFWGLICVTFKFPDVLDPVQLKYLSRQGYDYQLSRIHPESGNKVVLLGVQGNLPEAVEREIALPNTVWTLSVLPQGGWKAWNLRYGFWGIATFISLLFSCVVGLTVDLADKKKRLERMSEQDMLTGLPNRRALFRELEKAKAAARPFALCYMDLNRFKEINDTYGHDAGDQLLRQFADRLRASLRSTGTVVRLGGDEFIVILYDITDREEALHRCVTLLDLVSEVPYRLDEHEITATASMGLALYPSEASTLSDLLRKADSGMYRNKKRHSA